jgi:hypothetical protein
MIRAGSDSAAVINVEIGAIGTVADGDFELRGGVK